LLSACGGTPTPFSITTGPALEPVSPGIATAIAGTTSAQAANNQTQIAQEVVAALTGTAAPATNTPDTRATLPPTWTLTFTPTRAPPTATITPSLTPTPTPTLSAETICDAFFSVDNLRPGEIFAWDDTITLYVNPVPPDATVRFLAVQHFSGENRGADLPGGGANILRLPIRNLPQTGQYDWMLVVKTGSYGDICEQSGWFIAAGRNSTRAEEDTVR